MIWIAFSLIAVLAQASFIELNRKLKLEGFRLNLLASLFSGLYLAPFLPWMSWPGNGTFYLVAFLAAAASTVGGITQFYMAAAHNGRTASMYMPVKAFVMFCLWLVIDPALLDTYASSPRIALGIFAAFTISVISLFSLRKNDIGWKAFLLVAPLGALFAASNILIKTSFTGDIVLSWVLCFNFLFFIFMALQTAPIVAARYHPEKAFLNKRMLTGAALVGLCSVLSFMGITGGIVTAPNPAYVAIMQMMIPACIMCYHKVVGIRDDTSPLAGLGLVLGAIILIFATQA